MLHLKPKQNIKMMNISINQINDALIEFLKFGIPEKYKNGKYPFYDEDDLVSEVHRFLKTKTAGSRIKVFREYPVHQIAPVKLTKSAYMKLSAKYPLLKDRECYTELTTDYYALNKDYKYINELSPFPEVIFNIDGKYNRVYESKYFDLVVHDEYLVDRPDELSFPKIVIEFKYEASKSRRNPDGDMRRCISLPKNNKWSVLRDLDALNLYCQEHPDARGIFVFLDEESGGKNINSFVPDIFKPISSTVLKNTSKGGIWVKTFNG